MNNEIENNIEEKKVEWINNFCISGLPEGVAWEVRKETGDNKIEVVSNEEPSSED